VFDRMDEYLVRGYLSSAAVLVKAAQAREAGAALRSFPLTH